MNTLQMYEYTAKVGRRETKGQFYAVDTAAAHDYINRVIIPNYNEYNRRFQLVSLNALNANEEDQVKAGA